MYTISIGPLSLPADRLLLIVSLVVALIVSAIVARKSFLNADGTLCAEGSSKADDTLNADGSIASLFIIAMLTARVSFVIRYFEQYRGDWLGMIDIRDGGFDIVAGAIGAVIAMSWLLWRKSKIRKALLSGVLAGCCVWGVISLSLWAINDTSQYLPKVVVSDFNGQSVELTRVESNKPRVINLWATWCPPCRREMPVLQQAQEDYPEFGFIFANQGEHQQVVAEYLQRESITIDNVMMDSKGQLGSLIGSRALPTTIFVSAKGELVDAHLGELSRATLTQKLERLETLSQKEEVEK